MDISCVIELSLRTLALAGSAASRDAGGYGPSRVGAELSIIADRCAFDR